MVQANPGASFEDIARLIGQKWKNLTDMDKQKYEDMTSKDVERYLIIPWVCCVFFFLNILQIQFPVKVNVFFYNIFSYIRYCQ